MASQLFRSQLAYKEWQVKRLLAAVRDLPADTFEPSRGSSHGGIKGTLQHMYGADFIWMRRLKGASLTRADVVLPDTREDLEDKWLKLIAEWREWATSVPDSGWEQRLDYTMFDGSQRSNSFWQIVLHVVNHGTLHGGQVVGMLRQAGVTPPQTDLIFFYREMEAAAAA
jgi:uncharacterized damage-inducible protein DinB